MRPRKEIIKDTAEVKMDGINFLKLEVLLDIRDLLIELNQRSKR